ncbi:MAG: S8/S53 family peptidase, partial [Pseudomonadota bacterium]
MNASQTRRCARHAGLAVLLLSALWLGLPAQAQTLECDATGAGTEPPTDLCLTAESADTPWRYVGITNGAQCPPSPSWTTSRLFAPSGDGVIPPGLRAFCLYEAATDVPNVEELMLRRCDAPEPPPTCLSSLDPDAAAMALMGSDLSSVIWEPLREHFLEQVGYVGALPTVAPNTRLAVIDTEPTGPGDDPQQARTSRHGFTLVSLIRDVLCDGSRACAVEVQAQLGLPLVRCPSVTGFCRNEAEGGYVGTIGDLAMAIRQQVENWGASGVDNLIINLSVAWDPRFGGEAPISNSRVAAQAVYRALQDARCRGAIIVAAAGNRISGPDANVGALLPAGWETEAAPDGTTCQNLIGQMPDPVDFAGTYQPLVYAAGAVRTDGSEAETRNDGEPRLVTYGDHAVARLGGAGQPAP